MEELEQLLISALLNNPSGVLEAEIAREDFTSDFYGYVFSRMKSLYAEKQNFSVVDFVKEISTDEFNHLREVVSICLSSSHATIRDYCLAIKQQQEKTAILQAACAIKPEMSLEEMRHTIRQIGDHSANKTKIKTGAEVFEDVRKALEMPPACSPTGLQCLDDAMGGGLYQGFTYGLCGAEKSGKTTLAHTISYNLDKAGTKHLYVALEMGSQYIEQRNIGRDLGLNSLAFLNKRDLIRQKMQEATPRQSTFYLDAPGFTLEEILSESCRAIVRHGVTGLIVDYWQLVGGADRRETEERHLRNVAQSLADFGKKNKIWIILLAQMNKGGELFGGGGLRKACEQLYMIRTCDNAPSMRWLEMDVSRYTLKVNVGAENDPSLVMEQLSGPFFRER